MDRTNSRYSFRDIDRIDYNSVKRKREDTVDDLVPNKKIKIEKEFEYETESVWDEFNTYYGADDVVVENVNKEWVSGTAVKNYLLKDPILDWLKYRHGKNTDVHNYGTGTHHLFEMGDKFESTVFDYLDKKYKGYTKLVVEDTSRVNTEHSKQTFKFMKDGVPIIKQAALYNSSNKTCGVADLLIRSDWINKIVETPVVVDSAGSSVLKKKYHYVVVDIKWTTMYLCADGRHIRNSHRFPSYKGQLAIYNAAVGQLQGYTPSTSYILAKSWKYSKNGDMYNGYDCFERLGEIDFESYDSNVIHDTVDAIKWVRNVRYNNSKWTCNPPSRKELYPNMCNVYDAPYHNMKKDIAENINELTQLWMVGVKNRTVSHKNGVYSWSDPMCSSETMGVKGKKISPIIDKIIEMNRDSDSLVEPKVVTNNYQNWQKNNKFDFYVDLESINSCFYDKSINLRDSREDNGVVFMIGVGYIDKGKWKYRCFSMERYCIEEERRIIDEFTSFIDSKVTKKRKPVMFHWGDAERTLFNTANRRHNMRWTSKFNSMNWVDFCRIFKSEPIVVKGAKKFNLKEVTNAMNSLGLINISWDNDGPADGLSAMISAVDYYKGVSTDSFKRIIEYNEVDCRSVYEIVNYLRNNNCVQ